MTSETTGGQGGDVVRAWASAEGVFIGPSIALIRRNRHSGGQPFELRPSMVIESALTRLWGREIDLHWHSDALNGAMLALNRGDLALARQIARGIALPPVPDALRKEWDESQHPRQPAGSPEGGEFAPANGDGSGTPTQGADASATQVAAAPKPRQVPPPVSETAPGVDWKFIEREENKGRDARPAETGYVPTDKDGNVLGRSGVTVATGVDLGKRSVTEIDNLDIPEELKAKLREYAGRTGQPALDYLASHPLTLSSQEVSMLDDAVRRQIALEFTQKYDAAAVKIPGALPFRDLPPHVQTGIMSYVFQRGPNLDRTPVGSSNRQVWDAIVSQDWDRAADAVQAATPQYRSRRLRESRLIRLGRNPPQP